MSRQCTCQEWLDNIDKVNAPGLLLIARNPQSASQYRGVKFRFCPWCASALTESPTQETVPARILDVEGEWNCANREQQSKWAEDAGLLRVSSFARDLPIWSQLPEDWRPKLVPHVRAAQNR